MGGSVRGVFNPGIANGLLRVAPAGCPNDQRRAVLDASPIWIAVHQQRSCQRCGFQTSDPTSDHAAVRVILREEQIGDILPLNRLERRPVRIRLHRRLDEREAWQRAVESALPRLYRMRARTRFKP